jgi:hypothetical protein
MINLENYEIYIIDYLDGKLNSHEVDELLAFLDLHPSIKDDFYAIAHSNVKILDKSEVYPDKEKLKRNYKGAINKQNITEFLILNLENELNPLQKKDLENFIEFFPETKKELIAFEKTKLIGDTSIHFPSKETLYRKEISMYFYFNRIAIAAILILAFGFAINFYNKENNNSTNTEIALAKPDNKSNEIQPSIEVESKVKPLSTAKNNDKAQKEINTKSTIKLEPKIEGVDRIERQTLQPLELKLASTINTPTNKIRLAQGSIYLNMPIANSIENKTEQQNSFLSPKELLFARIKNVAKKSIQTDNPEENEKELRGSDLTALLVTGINELTGAEIKIINNDNSKGIALGNNESIEVGRGK